MAKYKNLQELILAASTRWKDKVAFRHIASGRVRSFKYSELAKLSYRIVEAFWVRGLRPGDYVAIWADNSPEWVLACLAAWRLGLVVVPLDSRARASEVFPVIERTSPKLVLTGRKQFVRIQERLEADQLALIDELSAPVGSVDLSKELPRIQVVGSDQPAMIVFTSGTSGASKGVVLTHGNILTNALSVSQSHDVNVDDRLLSILPLSHMFEFTAGMIGPLHKGATIVYSQLKGASHLKELMKVEKISVMLATPMVFQALLQAIHAEIEKLPRSKQIAAAALRQVVKANPALGPVLFRDLHNELGGKIKFWFAGGAPTPPDVIAQFASFGLPLLTGYGLTEAGPIVAANNKGASKAESVGRPILGVQVKIERSSEDSKSGEILVRGPNIMSHYFENPEETAKTVKDGWLHTGDSGYLDKDGYLHITGRLKSMIVTAGGYNIFPEELEEALSKSSMIKEVCVIGYQTPQGEEVAAAIVPEVSFQARPDKEARIKEEVATCLSDLADYKRLASYQIWDEDLPRTGIGKMRRGEVARLYALKQQNRSQERTPVEGVKWDDDGQRVCRIIGDVMDPDALAGLSPSGDRLFSPQANLTADLGLDSFARLELTCKLEEEFGIALEEDALQDAQTVEDLVLNVKGARKLCATRIEVLSGEKSALEEQVVDAILVESKPWPREWLADMNYPLQDNPLVAASRRLLGTGLKAFLKIYNNFETVGADRLLIEPPYIVAANHASHFDTAAIVGSFPTGLLKHVHPVAAADYWFNSPLAAAFSGYILNAVPFERYGNFEESMKDCEDLLKQSKILIIYPEGKRSLDGSMGQFKPGIAKLSILCNCPIIPAYIKGTFDVLPKGKAVVAPKNVKVSFGLPIYPTPGNADLKACQDLTRRVRESIEQLGNELQPTPEPSKEKQEV
jgi:long-chain acyl-CoA synthetase